MFGLFARKGYNKDHNGSRPVSANSYLSTRSAECLGSFSDILLQGLAPDGGLFLPKKIDLDKVDPTKIHASVPIEFSIKSALIQDLLTNIPHTKFTNSEGRIHIQFANNEYLFEPSFLDKFSTLRYAVFPVIFFSKVKKFNFFFRIFFISIFFK